MAGRLDVGPDPGHEREGDGHTAERDHEVGRGQLAAAPVQRRQQHEDETGDDNGRLGCNRQPVDLGNGDGVAGRRCYLRKMGYLREMGQTGDHGWLPFVSAASRAGGLKSLCWWTSVSSERTDGSMRSSTGLG